jgi:hypothetical protein
VRSVLLLLVIAAGCRQIFGLDSPILRDASDDPVDSAVDSAVDDARALDAPQDAYCEPITATPPSGHHNAGIGCMTSGGCHNESLGIGSGASGYSYAGTLYNGGAMPFPGATIVLQLGGAQKKVVTADNGNFWMVPGVTGLDPPTDAMTASARATACPSYDAAMIGALVQGGGNCNSCHHNGGPTQPIHLP